MSRHVRLAVLVLTALTPLFNLHAQVTGTISGYVTDQSGASVPGATVTATLVQQQVSRTVKSNIEGFFDFAAMPPGSYTLSVDMAGFQKLVRTDATLTVGQNLRIDLKLQVGQTAEAVTVSAEAPLVDSRSATLSALVDDRRVVDLPLNGRNVMALAITLPGVLSVSAPQQLSDARSGPTMNVNGAQPNMNLFTFNGGIFNNPSRNTGMNYPPPDAIQEFRVQTSNFSAEYGRNAGSQVSVVSKSGSNSFHGSAWEFLRNSALNARNFFSPRVPALRQNQFGAAAGGRIIRDKLFFFGSYQGLRDRPEAVGVQATVPSPAMRNGDFTGLGKALKNPADILTGQPFTAPGGAPCIQNNVINPGCISPVAKKMLDFVPASSTNRITTLSPNPRNDAMYMGRIDWNHNEKHSVFGNFYIDRNDQSRDLVGGQIAGWVGSTLTQQTTMVTINDTYTFSPRLLNQAMISFLRTTSLDDPSGNRLPKDYGINMPQYPLKGGFGADITGYLQFFGGWGIVRFTNNNWQFRDDVTWTVDKHSFKFGGEMLKLYWRQVFLGTPGFEFNGSRTGDAMADYLLGAYRRLSLGFGVRENDNLAIAPAFYFQDEFKVHPRFTLTYGVRYEPYLPWVDRYDRLAAIGVGRQSQRIPDAPPGILYPGDPGIPRGLVNADKNNFAPRVGIAWDMFGDGKTSLRAAWGVFYDAIKASSLAQEDAPWSGSIQTFNGRMEDPFASVGLSAPPVTPGTTYGCVKTSAFPGVRCDLYPLPVSGLFVDGSLRTGYIQSWNLTIQRQLTPDLMLQSGYIGKLGTKIEGWRNFNPARFINDPVTGAPPSLQNVNNRALFAPGILSPQAIMLGSDFRLWYHSWQTQITKRLSRGLSVSAAYTLGKSLDTLSSNTFGRRVDNPWSVQQNRGRSDYDRRHAFVASWLWSPTIRFSNPVQQAVMANWTFTGIHTIQSGAPITFAMGDDVALDGSGGRQRAQWNGQPIAREHTSRADMVAQFFNTSAFVHPSLLPRGIYGNSGRNILSGPAMSNTDFSAMKDFPFKEAWRVQFRSEFFNVFNQVNFSNPIATVNSGTFGQIRSAGASRVIQFALKMLW